MTPVGIAPVPVTVACDGQLVIAGNSNRFDSGEPSSTLSVIDASKDAVIRTIPVGSFPRDILVSRDGRTLLVANFNSKTVQASPLN
jgi:YVTN family beta-propeller protein